MTENRSKAPEVVTGTPSTPEQGQKPRSLRERAGDRVRQIAAGAAITAALGTAIGLAAFADRDSGPTEQKPETAAAMAQAMRPKMTDIATLALDLHKRYPDQVSEKTVAPGVIEISGNANPTGEDSIDVFMPLQNGVPAPDKAYSVYANTFYEDAPGNISGSEFGFNTPEGAKYATTFGMRNGEALNGWAAVVSVLPSAEAKLPGIYMDTVDKGTYGYNDDLSRREDPVAVTKIITGYADSTFLGGVESAFEPSSPTS